MSGKKPSIDDYKDRMTSPVGIKRTGKTTTKKSTKKRGK